MGVLGLKLLLAPSLVVAASLAGRRWGPQLAGWVAGFPIIAGPISLFFALENGQAFGARAAQGTLTGIVSMSAYAVTYAWAARHWHWAPALLGGYAAFAVSTVTLRNLDFRDVMPHLAMAAVATATGLRLLPELRPAYRLPGGAKGDLPLRVIATAALVLLVTGMAAGLGPTLSGMLAPFPVAGTVLVVFAHREHGPEAAVRVLKGFLTALFAFASFFAVLGFTLETWSIPLAFGTALAVAALVQGLAVAVTMWSSRRGPRRVAGSEQPGPRPT